MRRAAADPVWHYPDHAAQHRLLVLDNVDDPTVLDEHDRKLSEDSTALVDQGAAGTGSGRSRHLVGHTWQLCLDALAGQGLPEASAAAPRTTRTGARTRAPVRRSEPRAANRLAG
ncbi:hypothetical protein [Streptomyces cucumeris]|uniref:hypothetical protein n=1 Tax=Streptomyces cucumeris TaxID=2962890 RepID=UPI0020C8AFF5|nr:hypothetical protein [Streptomyces sp. NEAU-Y11]MCP9207378.1 hypothetical protein [Streptomyces sp. NEAU-Y11]